MNDLSDQGTRLMFLMIRSCCKCNSRNYVAVVDCKAPILQNEMMHQIGITKYLICSINCRAQAMSMGCKQSPYTSV